MIHPDSVTQLEMALGENLEGESPRNILHLYERPGGRTFCGRKFLRLAEGVCIASTSDFFGDKPLRPTEKLCKKCEASEQYKERYALWLLAKVGEE